MDAIASSKAPPPKIPHYLKALATSAKSFFRRLKPLNKKPKKNFKRQQVLPRLNSLHELGNDHEEHK
jgi:hypothetical protein